jgi:hypothetical protein
VFVVVIKKTIYHLEAGIGIVVLMKYFKEEMGGQRKFAFILHISCSNKKLL